MCGIFAVATQNLTAPNLVIEGLKKLEYRGYDSWGVAFQPQKERSKLEVIKTVGKISDYQDPESKLPGANIAIGHTRWATHGGVTEANSHPHTNEAETIAVVHNGIIENYSELKKDLIAKGHEFTSETDTEVAAHLIEEYLEHGLIEAVKMATLKFTGRFAIVVIDQHSQKIIAARRGSPLIVGRGKGQNFIASDIPAFLKHTRKVNYLDDDELVVITEDTAEFSSLKTGTPVEKRLITIDWQEEDAEKGEFDHFMLKEIFDQKETLFRAIEQSDQEIEEVAQSIINAKGVFWVGCGTAGKACHAGEYFFASVAKRHTNFAPASEFPLFHNFLLPETLVFAISQSGETADVLEAIEVAQKANSKVFSLVNVTGSSIARKSDRSIFIKAGPEKAVASTKAMSSQLAILLLLAYAAAGKLQEGKTLLAETASNVNELLNPRFVQHVEKIAQHIKDRPDLFIIGKGANYPMALEAAIKILEVSQIHAEGFASGELKHGPIAMIEDQTPCLVLVGDDEWSGEIIQNAIELKARGAEIIGVAPENNEAFDHFIRVPSSGAASPIVNLIPVQLLSFFLALARGKNPDMPKNLAKSVTVK
jgi:glucosamine--fructose-6-phosphate aminotransferase (isomerizing)